MNTDFALLNQSLDYVSAPYTQNLVTTESCKAFIEQQLFWNSIYPWILGITLIFIFYLLYKQGKFNKEVEALKKDG